jgi:predicted PurR-regulated permease PerM
MTVTVTTTPNPGESQLRWRNRMLAGMLGLLALYSAVLAKAVVVPILVAVLLGLLLAPAVRRLCRWRVPRPLASLLVLVAALAAFGVGLTLLAAPAREALTTVPRGMERVEQVMRQWRQPIERVSRSASQSYQRLVDLANGESAGAGARSAAAAPSSPGLAKRFAATVPGLLAGAVIVVFLTFLLLLHGDAMLRKAASLLRSFQDRRRLVQTTRRAQHQLSRYVLTITLINLCLGIVVAGMLHLLGVENALLWGGLAAVLNFAPYVGPLIGVILLTLAGVAQFGDPAQALLPPALYLLIQAVEGQLVTPLVLGRSMALDPVLVFLSMLLLGWLWGVVGLLLAVPMLTCLRICAEQVPGWFGLARLLGPATPIDPERLHRQLMRSARLQRRGAVPRDFAAPRERPLPSPPGDV